MQHHQAMATLVHTADKQFCEYSAAYNLDLYVWGVLHIVWLQEDTRVHKAEV